MAWARACGRVGFWMWMWFRQDGWIRWPLKISPPSSSTSTQLAAKEKPMLVETVKPRFTGKSDGAVSFGRMIKARKLPAQIIGKHLNCGTNLIKQKPSRATMRKDAIGQNSRHRNERLWVRILQNVPCCLSTRD